MRRVHNVIRVGVSMAMAHDSSDFQQIQELLRHYYRPKNSPSPYLRVAGLPTTTSPRLARVMATFRRLRNVHKCDCDPHV